MINCTKETYQAHKETIHNFIWRSLQIFGKQGITFLIFILCAKLLTPYDFGIYNYALAIIFFLIMFGDFGISTATSKYVAEYNVTNKAKLKAVLFNSGLIILALTILITIITLIFGPMYLKDKYVYVLYLLPLVFLAPMTSLYDGIYRGLKKFKQLAIISLVIGFVSMFFVYYFVKVYGLMGALIAQNLFYLILLVGLGLGYKEFSFKLNKGVMKEIGGYSFAFGVATLGYFLFSRIAILILGHYNYISEIATYELLNKIFMLILTPFIILGNVISPNFTILNTKKKYFLIFSKLKKYILTFIVTSIILSIVFYIIIPRIIELFFKEYYNITLFNILIPVIIIYAVQVYCATINSGIIIATGYASIFAYMNTVLGIFNVILSTIFVKYYGYVGVIYTVMILHLIAVFSTHLYFYYSFKENLKNEKT